MITVNIVIIMIVRVSLKSIVTASDVSKCQYTRDTPCTESSLTLTPLLLQQACAE